MPEERGLYRELPWSSASSTWPRLKGMSGAGSAKPCAPTSRGSTWPSRGQEGEGAQPGHAAEGPVHRHAGARPAAADPGRAILRAGPGEHSAHEGGDRGTSASRGKAIIMSSHQMHQVEQMCDRILLINGGLGVLYGGVDEVKQRYSANAVRVWADAMPSGLPGVSRVVRENGGYRLTLAAGVTPQDVLRAVCGLALAERAALRGGHAIAGRHLRRRRRAAAVAAPGGSREASTCDCSSPPSTGAACERRGFVVASFLLPLLVAGASWWPCILRPRQRRPAAGGRTSIWPACCADSPTARPGRSSFRRSTTTRAARQAVLSGEVAAAFVIAPDYRTTRAVTSFSLGDLPASRGRASERFAALEPSPGAPARGGERATEGIDLIAAVAGRQARVQRQHLAQRRHPLRGGHPLLRHVIVATPRRPACRRGRKGVAHDGGARHLRLARTSSWAARYLAIFLIGMTQLAVGW